MNRKSIAAFAWWYLLISNSPHVNSGFAGPFADNVDCEMIRIISQSAWTSTTPCWNDNRLMKESQQ